MDFIDRFSTHLRDALVRAIRLATMLKSETVQPAHLFLSLALQKGCIAQDILRKQKIDAEYLSDDIAKLEKTEMQKGAGAAIASLSPFSQEAKISIEKAMLIAQESNHNYIGTEHLLCALLEMEDEQIEKILKEKNADIEKMEEQIDIVLGNAAQFPKIADMSDAISGFPGGLNEEQFMPGQMFANNRKSGKKESALDFFAVNLTAEAAQKNIDPVIGRENEIERVIHILCRRTKNNPVLLGDPGVGKTAIVEGLAKKIAQGQAPDLLLDKKIYALDMGLLIAGTTFRGEFEDRLHRVIDEVIGDPNIILFIDELHNIVGAGSNSGTMDASNILKPALARGQIRCIGATTTAEFKKYIESDPALERRFQPIYIQQSSVEDTVKILLGIKKNYEKYHHLKISDEAARASAALADRYISNKFLPDKAIDLLDETAAAKRLKIKPTASNIKLRQLKKDLEKIITKKEEAAEKDLFDEAVKLKEQEKKLKTEIQILSEQAKQTNEPTAIITAKDVALQLGHILNMPTSDLLFNEVDSLKDLEKDLQARVIGQDHVIKELVERVRRAKLELSAPCRPLASFIFTGPSGAGKTELAKILAAALYKNQDALIHLNMSEFGEQHSASKLLGSPAGYIGYREPNQFTDKIKVNPHSVILFDEIDKAHKDVTKLLLQMLENGEITDSTGKKISLNHAIIILTTSLGAEEISKKNIGFGDANSLTENKKRVLEKLKEYFSPELINRVDGICVFNALSKESLIKIAGLEINDLNNRLANHHTSLKADKKIFDWFVSSLTKADKNIGAREVRRKLRGEVEQLIAELILQNKKKSLHKLLIVNNRLSVQ